MMYATSLNPHVAESFSTLGLSPTSSLSEIKSAFRRRAKLVHPDISRVEGSKQHFQQLNHAYSTVMEWLEQEAASWELSATFLTVAKAHRGSFQSIGEAVRAAAANATILIKPGVYREGIILDKALHLIGDGPPGTIQISSAFHPPVSILAPEVCLEGLSIHGKSNRKRGAQFALVVDNGSATLRKCHIHAEKLSGIVLHGPHSRLHLHESEISHCGQAGIYSYDQANLLVEDCTIRDNGAPGLQLEEFSSATVRRTLIASRQAEAICLKDSSNCLLENSDLVAPAERFYTLSGNSLLSRKGMNTLVPLEK
ncbi:MAG: right-handed parallel beta-helix repeat-containing protein [Magnetococcales bacterium]|nr:right-handed parallel beta-helix repeat-containing protein [Magnetococcales bacterium]